MLRGSLHITRVGAKASPWEGEEPRINEEPCDSWGAMEIALQNTSFIFQVKSIMADLDKHVSIKICIHPYVLGCARPVCVMHQNRRKIYKRGWDNIYLLFCRCLQHPTCSNCVVPPQAAFLSIWTFLASAEFCSRIDSVRMSNRKLGLHGRRHRGASYLICQANDDDSDGGSQSRNY